MCKDLKIIIKEAEETVKEAEQTVKEAERTMELANIEYKKLLVKFRKYILKITEDRKDFRDWLTTSLANDFASNEIAEDEVLDDSLLDEEIEEVYEDKIPNEETVATFNKTDAGEELTKVPDINELMGELKSWKPGH